MTRQGAGLVLGATFSVQTLVSMAALVLPAIAPIAGARLGVDPVLIGLQVSLLYCAAMIAVLMSSTVVRRHGACRTSQAALLFVVAGCAAASIPSVWSVAFGSLLMGLAYGLPNPAAAHLLTRFTDVRRRNLIFSFKQAGVPAGGVLAGLIAPPLAEAVTWQAPLLLTAGLALCLAIGLQAVQPHWDDDRAGTGRTYALPLLALRNFLRDKALRSIALSGLLLAGLQLCFVAFMVVALVGELGVSVIAAGIMLAVLQAVSVLGRVGWGWIADRVGDGLAVLVFISAFLAVSFLVASTFDATTSFAIVLATFILISCTAVGWNGIYMAALAHASGPLRAGEVTGIAMFFTFLGVVLGPSAFSLTLPSFGGVLPAYLTLAMASLAACALLIVARRAFGARDVSAHQE
jgi:MFS family permease